GDRTVMLKQPFLRRLVVLGGHRQQAAGADLFHFTGEVDHLSGVVTARPGKNRRLAGGFVHQQLDNPQALGQGKRRALSGRAARHEEVNAGVHLPPAKAADGCFVELAGLRERRDQRGADSGPWRSHDWTQLFSMALGPHPQRELTLMPRLRVTRPRLGTPPQRGCRAGDPGMAAGARLLYWRWGPTPSANLC